MSTDELNVHYREEGWGRITDAALGIDPVNVETQARLIAQWAAAHIDQLTARIEELVQSDKAWGRLHQRVVEERGEALREAQSLAAWQCLYRDGKTGITSDEGGNQCCAMERKIDHLSKKLGKTAVLNAMDEEERLSLVGYVPMPVQIGNLRLGARVRTSKGAAFRGRLIAFHDWDGDLPGATVEATDAAFKGTRHVYPLKQLEPLDPVARAATPFRIKIGGTYRTRDGRKVGPMQAASYGTSTQLYQLDGRITTRGWYEDGTYIKGARCGLDLVDEWRGPPPPARED